MAPSRLLLPGNAGPGGRCSLQGDGAPADRPSPADPVSPGGETKDRERALVLRGPEFRRHDALPMERGVTQGGPAAVGVIARYGEYLPLSDATPRITLGEGDTPLVRSSAVERRAGAAEVWFKLESLNPTASFKDRGMVVAVAKAMERGARAIVCASTGNTSASAAAYAARCGLTAFVVVPDGRIAKGKLAQAVAYGAKVIAIEGSFDEALKLVREVAERHPIEVVNSINPNRIEGQKTAAFEVVDVLGDAPDLVCIPVGNAGNITAYWRGFREYHSLGKSGGLPRMMGFQAEGAAPIVLGHPVKDPTTIATAIRIGNPASWDAAVAARDESGGLIAAVKDSEILEAYRLLASSEGIFAEPASAASVAGLLKLPSLGVDLAGKRVVCVLTGSGLKDPDTAMTLRTEIIRIKPDAAAVDEVLAGAVTAQPAAAGAR